MLMGGMLFAFGRTLGPADKSYLSGHSWGTLSSAVRHPFWGALTLPLLVSLYVRRQTMAKIPRQRGWKFATKLSLAAQFLQGCGRSVCECPGD